MNKVRTYAFTLAALLIGGAGFTISNEIKNKNYPIVSIQTQSDLKKVESLAYQPIVENNEINEIKISFIGDCVLGDDPSFSYATFSQKVAEVNKQYEYFFSGVASILKNDDYTVANLEGPLFDLLQGENLTDYEAEKRWTFSGESANAQILLAGSVEAVNIANNHLPFDYGDTGYDRTIETLEKYGIKFFGEDKVLIKNIKGVRVGFISINNIKGEARTEDLKKLLDYLSDQNVDIKVVNMHAGNEYEEMFNQKQQELAHFAIDEGADIVIGHHPHILQGIEMYKGKPIAYSLGNFVFGGNNDPRDYDTMIFQVAFGIKDGKIVSNSINIIPCSISSTEQINDYSPQILTGSEAEAVYKKINERSFNFSYEYEKEELNRR